MTSHALLLQSLRIHEVHVYDAPCGCAAACGDGRRPLLSVCAHGNRWRYLATYRLHDSDRDAWCGAVIDGCVVEREAA